MEGEVFPPKPTLSLLNATHFRYLKVELTANSYFDRNLENDWKRKNFMKWGVLHVTSSPMIDIGIEAASFYVSP